MTEFTLPIWYIFRHFIYIKHFDSCLLIHLSGIGTYIRGGNKIFRFPKNISNFLEYQDLKNLKTKKSFWDWHNSNVGFVFSQWFFFLINASQSFYDLKKFTSRWGNPFRKLVLKIHKKNTAFHRANLIKKWWAMIIRFNDILL